MRLPTSRFPISSGSFFLSLASSVKESSMHAARPKVRRIGRLLFAYKYTLQLQTCPALKGLRKISDRPSALRAPLADARGSVTAFDSAVALQNRAGHGARGTFFSPPGSAC